jgi:MoxR-like ATPase
VRDVQDLEHAEHQRQPERDYVSPDDVQAILPQAIAHRLTPVAGCGRGPIEQVRAMVEATPIP